MTNPFSLSGKTILVTGASSGIGRQICVSASQMGAQIIAGGRNKERLDATMEQLEGSGHICIQADLSVQEEIERLAGEVPQLDGLVHAAGVLKIIPLKMVTIKDLEQIQFVNYYSPLLINKYLLKNKKLRQGGSVIFISSVSSLAGAIGYGMYAGTKSGLNAISRVLALELAGQKIRVNCIAPGMVKTQMFTDTEKVISPQQLAEHEKMYPLGFGEPIDVANAVVFLLSDASKWITGITLTLDGGFLIK